MKERLMNNIGLKVLAFLAASMLWLMVVNIDDPVTTKTFYNIPVSVVNEEVLSESNQTYQIVDDTQTVSVTVKAKRKTLNRIKNEDIIAIADMKELTLKTQIPISISIKGYDGKYESAEASPRNLQVKLDDEQTKKFPIVPTTTGTVRDGYALGEIKASPEKVSIRGPKTVISKISRVEASVNVSGLSEDAVLMSELVLYDDENNIIDQSLLTNNLGEDGVSVSVQLLQTKNVPITFDTSQIQAAEGYAFAGITCEPETVLVSGTKAELRKIDEIHVPAEVLALTNLTGKKEQVVDITQYLPETVKLVDENAGSVVVIISVEKDGTKTFDVSLGAIVVTNLADGLNMKYSSVDAIELQIRGPKDVLESYDIQKKTSINLKDYTEPGTYEVPVEVKLPSGCTLEEPVMVSVILEKKGN